MQFYIWCDNLPHSWTESFWYLNSNSNCHFVEHHLVVLNKLVRQ